MGWQRRFTLRRRLLRSQGWLCATCPRWLVDYGPEDGPHRATLDHIIPRAHGGRDADWNLRVVCRACNQARADAVTDDDLATVIAAWWFGWAP